MQRTVPGGRMMNSVTNSSRSTPAETPPVFASCIAAESDVIHTYTPSTRIQLRGPLEHLFAATWALALGRR